MDDADLLSPAEKSRLEALIAEQESADPSVRVGVVTRWDAGDEAAGLARKTVEAWDAAAGDGAPRVVLVVEMKERKIGIGVDSAAQERINWGEEEDIRYEMKEDLHDGRYEAGLEAGVRSVHEKSVRRGPGDFGVFMAVFLVVVFGGIAALMWVRSMLSPTRFRARREARTFAATPEGLRIFGPEGMPRWAVKDYVRYRRTFRRPPYDEAERQAERDLAWRQGRPPHPDTDFLRRTQFVPDLPSWLHWYRQSPSLYSDLFHFPPGLDEYSFGRRKPIFGSGNGVVYNADGGGGADF